MQKKYELLPKEENGLCRIKALIDIPDYGVKIGDIGGYIESEKNLSHEGKCWVSGDAWVFGNARVYENAQVSGNSWVSGDAKVFGNARVYGDAEVFGQQK